MKFPDDHPEDIALAQEETLAKAALEEAFAEQSATTRAGRTVSSELFERCYQLQCKVSSLHKRRELLREAWYRAHPDTPGRFQG
jgi:hypothetical protein